MLRLQNLFLLLWLVLWPACAPAATWGNTQAPFILDADSEALAAVEVPAGLHLYRLAAPCAYAPYASLPGFTAGYAGDPESADAWLEEGKYRYTYVDARLAALLARDPEARVLLRVQIDSPPWWERAHPQALVPVPKGADRAGARKASHASWYAVEWRQAAAQALQSLVRHVESGLYASRIVGYELDSGRHGAWGPWHQTAAAQETGAAAQAAYRAWLQRKYGSLAALRVAWGQPRQPVMDSPEVKAGFILTQWNQVTIPAARALLDTGRPTLFDPSGQQHLADYQQFLGDYTAGVILELIRAGRQAAPAGREWGACYGHLLWWPEEDWPPSLSGQLGLGRILASPDMDFLVGPPGAGDFPSTLVGSLRVRGKRYLAQPEQRVTGAGALNSGCGLICTGPKHLATAEQTLVQAAEPPRLTTVLVVDESSLAHLSPATDFQQVTLQEQARQLASGPPWEGYLLNDLLAAPESDLYLMAATYRIPERLRPAVLARLSQAGVVMWVYAAGALDSGYIDPSAIFTLTGLKLTIVGAPAQLRTQVVGVQAGDRPVVYGPEQAVQPWFPLLEGPQALGQILEKPWTGLAWRRANGQIIAYSTAPGVPQAVLERLLEERRLR